MSLTISHWLMKHRPVASVPLTLLESTTVPPPRSPAAAYAGLSCGSPQAERAGVPFVEYLGRTLRGESEEKEQR
jgi:hypothetical protein